MLAPRKLQPTNVGIIPIKAKRIPKKFSEHVCPIYTALAISRS
jgi:hypothetical protein